MKEELYNKIDKFCNETDWSKYPTYEHALEEFIKGIVAEETLELEKENAELDCQKNRNKFCYSCANATEKCFKNEIGCPCDKYKSYKGENAELKDDNKVMADNYSKMEQKFYNNLTKAKEIIKDLLSYSVKLDSCLYTTEYEASRQKAIDFLGGKK